MLVVPIALAAPYLSTLVADSQCSYVLLAAVWAYYHRHRSVSYITKPNQYMSLLMYKLNDLWTHVFSLWLREAKNDCMIINSLR